LVSNKEAPLAIAGLLCLKPNARMVKCAPGFVPFTRASSAGLTGKRVIGCLRLEEPSFMTPRQAEQRSEPEGPRSRVPRGIAKGGWASSPPWLAVKGERQIPPPLRLETCSRKLVPTSSTLAVCATTETHRSLLGCHKKACRPTSQPILRITPRATQIIDRPGSQHDHQRPHQYRRYQIAQRSVRDDHHQRIGAGGCVQGTG